MFNLLPVICTLDGESYRARLAWIKELMGQSLRSYERRDLVLDLRLTAESENRVRQMVLMEQECCKFLTFEVARDALETRLTITAPENARTTATFLFDEFLAQAQEASEDTTSTPPQFSRGGSGR